MNTIEFVLWLNGAVGVLGDGPPTAEQWDSIKLRLEQAVGGIVAKKLLETAENVHHEQTRRQKEEAEKYEYMIKEMQAKQRVMMQRTLSPSDMLNRGLAMNSNVAEGLEGPKGTY